MRMLAALDVVDDVNGVAVDALQHGCRRGYRIGMRYGALAMTEHADTTAAVTTAATNRVRVRMLGICRQGLTCMTASRAGKRALLKIAIRRPQPAARGI